MGPSGLNSTSVNFENLAQLFWLPFASFFNQYNLYEPSFTENPIQNVFSQEEYFQPPKTALISFLLSAPSVKIHSFTMAFCIFLFFDLLFWKVFSTSLNVCDFLPLHNSEPSECLCLSYEDLLHCCALPLPLVCILEGHLAHNRHSLNTEWSTANVCRWLQNSLPCGKGMYVLFFPNASEMLITLVSLIMPHILFLSQQRVVNHWFFLYYLHYSLCIPAAVC